MTEARCPGCGEPDGDRYDFQGTLYCLPCWGKLEEGEHGDLRDAEAIDRANGVPVYTNGNGHANESPTGRQLVLRVMADVDPESVRWAWRGRIVLGMLNVIVGEPGLGKSTFVYDLAAKLSRGDLDGDLYTQPANVLVVTYEDHIASVVRPRLEAAGADLLRVQEIGIEQDGTEDLLELPRDIELIRQAIEHTQARLLTVDPIVASLAGDINSHKDHDVRRVLAPLAQLAERYGLAVVVVMHVNKSMAKQFFQRVGASVGFTGAARSMLLVARDPDDPDGERGLRRVLAHGKCNVGPLERSLSFEIEPAQTDSGIETSRLRWLGESETTTADLLGADGDDERTDTELAGEWLADELADCKWHESRVVKERAKLAGLSERTLQRAKKRLEIDDRRDGFPAVSEWRLPVAPTVAPAGSSDGGGATVKPPVTIDDQPGLWSQSRQHFVVGATGDEKALVEQIKDVFTATEIGEDEWAEYERTHDVETWEFSSS